MSPNVPKPHSPGLTTPAPRGSPAEPGGVTGGSLIKCVNFKISMCISHPYYTTPVEASSCVHHVHHVHHVHPYYTSPVEASSWVVAALEGGGGQTYVQPLWRSLPRR